MVGWLRDAMGLPTTWSGVIQDSASSATLSAVLTMRERATGYTGNREGLHAIFTQAGTPVADDRTDVAGEPTFGRVRIWAEIDGGAGSRVPTG